MEAAARNQSAQDEANALQSGIGEAPSGFEPLYGALQAPA
jgi:hypothetical protein